MSEETIICQPSANQFEFLKAVGDVQTGNLLPYYGELKKDNVFFRRIPIVIQEILETPLDKNTMLFPLFSKEEVTEKEIVEQPKIPYEYFVSHIEEFEEIIRPFFIIVTPKQIRELYSDPYLVCQVNDYFAKINGPKFERIRK